MARVDLDYRSIAVFRPFHQSRAYERSLFGGYGSGKSWALCAEALAVGLEQPGCEILICRKTVPSLRDTTEAIFTSLIPADMWKRCDTRRMGNHYESITLPNGTRYMFRGLDDWMKLKSLTVAWIFYDEADEIDEETYIGLRSRVRQTLPTPEAKAQGASAIVRRGIVAASNPAGHNWCWQRFVEEGGEKHAPNSEFFTSSSLDNPHLPLEYIQSLLDMPDAWVRRYVLCDFDEFAGQIYTDWGWDTHVIDPFKDGTGYTYDPAGSFIMGFDPGTSAGNAAVWCYYDLAANRLVAVAEYDEHGLAASVHADEWRRIEARHKMKVRTRIADPKAITVRDRGSNMGLDAQYRRLGFNFQLGTNKPETRIPALGQLIFQRRFVVTKECPRLAELLGQYRWEDLTPMQRTKGTEAKAAKKGMDLVDAAQYVACKYIVPPKVVPKLTPGEAHNDEIRQAIRKQIAARNATQGHGLGKIAV